MRGLPVYLLLLLSWTMVFGFNSCNKDSDNPDDEIVVYMKKKVQLRVGSESFPVSIFDNATGRAFMELLPLTLDMSELNDNEKYFGLSESLPTDSFRPSIINKGDVMLYGSSTLVLFYKTFSTSYSYSRIGTVSNPSGLDSVLGSGNVTVIFKLAE